MIRVRFAPSPTGTLHIGSLRTALFNWIFAKNQKATYILRIEDTDKERSKLEYEQNIIEGLEWMGLSMDEGPGIGGPYGPYRQSERLQAGLYEAYAQKLIAAGFAYPCFCNDQDLERARKVAESQGKTFKYNRHCLTLAPDDISRRIAAGNPYVLRFKMPDSGAIVFQDLIRGEIQFEASLLSDFILIKSDKTPSYNFAVVVDDICMKITHIVRGEDHISNTPRQICLYRALQTEPPQFAHLPMILGPDRSKLSKRHGATSVTEYQEQGYTKDALFNYLVLLGWSSPDERELMSREEIVSLFSLDRISKSGAVFDIAKLKWMNGQYIRKMDPETLYKTIHPYFNQDEITGLAQFPEAMRRVMVFSLHDKLELLTDIHAHLAVYLFDDNTVKTKLQDHTFSPEDQELLRAFHTAYVALPSLTIETVSALCQEIVQKRGLPKPKLFKPLRMAVSGQMQGPDLCAFLAIMDRETVGRRLENIIS